MSTQHTILGRFLLWRIRHIPHKQFILLLSFVTGLIGGLIAVLLKNIVHYTHEFVTGFLNENDIHYLYIALPTIGIILTFLFVKYVVKDNIGHGVSKILFSISKKNGFIKPHNSYSSVIASTFTVGFGGSVGLEAPIVLTGSAIGSNIGRLMKLNYRSTTLLIGCGAAGAIAGIFKAPIAAVVFGLEVLLLDLTMASLIPMLISSVTGAVVSYFLLGKGVLFSFTLTQPFALSHLPYFVLLGLVAGLISTYLTKASMRIESRIALIKRPSVKILMGGVSLGLLIYLFPPLYGEGYETLRALLHNQAEHLMHGSLFQQLTGASWGILLFMLLILLFKPFASSLTNGTGGVGGIFAPTLFMGGITGFILARAVNNLGMVQLPEENFALVGMAGLMAGVMHAPLTAIFLIAEITGGYALFIPLIITSTISYLTIMYFEPHSIYHKRLAKKGELITHNKDKAILQLIDLNKVIEKDFKKVKINQTLGDLVKVISKSKRNIFPVVDDKNQLLGVVLLDNIRDVIFNSELYPVTSVESLMILPPTSISSKDSMEKVMQKFKETGAWNLPVLNDGKYVGFISKSKLFSVYRRWLVDISED